MEDYVISVWNIQYRGDEAEVACDNEETGSECEQIALFEVDVCNQHELKEGLSRTLYLCKQCKKKYEETLQSRLKCK